MSKFTIAIHGGAGVIPKTLDKSKADNYLDGLKSALEAGLQVLQNKGTAIEAVQAAVLSMENNPLFNAGFGAVYTAKAEHELDASIMDGKTLHCGAVAGVKRVKNPVLLANKIMESSEHILFGCDGAEELADNWGLEIVPNSYFDTDIRYQQLQNAIKADEVILDHSQEIKTKGTVGAVALDMYGNLAAATSTGGMTNKKPGRIGDSPLIGCGNYANNQTCAVSCTGKGEQFIRHVAAFDVHALMHYTGKTLAEACHEVIFNKLDAGDGGLIAVDKDGNFSLVFNSKGMFRGVANDSGHFEVKIWE